MLHTRHGWWLEEAGEVTPERPLEGDTHADVVIVGGGYLGMWTAWHLLELEPELDVLVLESAVCGHGPSGRNGGFCESLWGDAPTLRDHAGDAAALAVCRASEDAVRGIGAWCETNGVDAWFRERRCCGSRQPSRRSDRGRTSFARSPSSGRPTRSSPSRPTRCGHAARLPSSWAVRSIA